MCITKRLKRTSLCFGVLVKLLVSPFSRQTVIPFLKTVKSLIIIITVLFLGFGCKTLLKDGEYPPSGNWTDCNDEFTSPNYSVKTFENHASNGFWITVLDSTDLRPLPNTWIKYGFHSKPKKTDESGNLFLNTASNDTVYLNFIGFDKRFFYRAKASIDSVVIFMSPCTTVIVE